MELDKERIELALKLVKVAEADVQAAEASLAEARAILDKYQAEVDRWDSEVKRLDERGQAGRGRPPDPPRVDQPVEVEHRCAERGEGDDHEGGGGAALRTGDAREGQGRRLGRPCRPDCRQSEARRLEAWVGYLTLTAPFDGVIVARNANTFDFVLPATGDPTAMSRSPYQSPGGTAAPIYVVDRIDVVRIFVDIPAQDANYVHIGTKATVLVKALPRRADPGHRHAHVLGAERQEPHTPCRDRPAQPRQPAPARDVRLRQGDHRAPGVRALPLAALTYRGDQAFYWMYENGKAVRTEIETGVSDGEWIEVTNRRAPGSPTAPAGKRSWTPIDGSEQVILGDLSILTEGGPVTEAKAITKTTTSS